MAETQGTSTTGTVDYDVTSRWDGGFVVEARFTPQAATEGWRVVLELEGELVNVWNARIVERIGDTYVLESLSYNDALDADQTTGFGFQATGSPRSLSFHTDGASEPPTPTVLLADASAPEGDPSDGGGDGNDGSADEPASLIGPLSTRGAEIINADGEAVRIQAVSWFGMETVRARPDGLYDRNWRDMMDQMQELGFNAIRVPFSLDAILQRPTLDNFDASLNPDLVGRDSLEILDEIVGYAEEIGLGIILDNHRSAAGDGPNPGGNYVEGGYTDADWIGMWELLAQRYADNEAIVGADLVNEPHAMVWQDWAAVAERAGDAVLALAPDWLIFVEGVGQYQNDYYWWGGALQGVRDRPVRLAVDDKLVYSPHDYPASVFPQPWFFDGSDLTEVFRNAWGFIHEEEIAPIWLGEFGSRLESDVDRRWGEAIVSYLSGDYDNDGTVDPDATPISYAWWSWNPNSGDTGGILLDDWSTPRQNALTLLEPILEPSPGSSSADANTIAFTVELSEPASEAIEVAYRTVDGSATAGEDFVGKEGTLTFAPGETSKSVAVTLLPDLVAEGDEMFTLSLTGPDGIVEAIGIIEEDDGGSGGTPMPPKVSIADVTVAEEDGSASLAVTLAAPAASDLTVRFETMNGSAGPGSDYVARSGSLTLPAAATEGTITIDIIDDDVAEPQERFSVRLTSAEGATIVDGSGAVTITDTDTPPPPPPPDDEALTVAARIVNDWGSGAQLLFLITNESGEAVDDWTLLFEAPAKVTQLWGGNIVGTDALDYTVDAASWNAAIAPDQTREVGFLVSSGGDLAAWLQAAEWEALA